MWFALVVALGATDALGAGGLGTPGLGVMVGAPLLIAGYLSWRRLAAIPLTTLIAVNAVRVLGVLFVALYANGRLPAPFAPTAGWGDIFIGATALPVVWALRREIAGARTVALIWNGLGLLDLIAALSLGVTSAEGSPVRLFVAEPSSAIMTDLPWLLIPGFLVPNLILIHLAVFRRLGQSSVGRAARPATA